MAIFKSHLLSKILIFEKNPFTTAVSMPKGFHLTPEAPTFEIHQPTLMYQYVTMYLGRCHIHGMHFHQTKFWENFTQ